MGKKFKIAFLCRDIGEVNRGVETYVIELSKSLGKSHDVQILSGSAAYSFSKIIKGGFDIVIPTNGRSQALKASFGRLVGGYKTIISGQSGIGKDDIWNIAGTFPDVYIALTEAEFKFAKKWSWKSKIVKIPNGVDLNKFSPEGEKAELKLPHPIVLSVGALHWYKYHERVIKAMARLQKGSLLIVGSGYEKEKLTKLAESSLGKDRFFIISTSYEELPKYYRAADIFTLPSWDREAFGIVYIEAMASGLPVVAPDDLARKEIVGEGGILVDVADDKKYAEAITFALSKNWGELPRKQAEKFSWDIVAEKYEELFEELF